MTCILIAIHKDWDTVWKSQLTVFYGQTFECPSSLSSMQSIPGSIIGERALIALNAVPVKMEKHAEDTTNS